MRCRKQFDIVFGIFGPSRDSINITDLIYLVTEKTYPGERVFGIGSPDIYYVSLASERTSDKVKIITRVLHVDQLGHHDVHRYLKSCLKHESKSKIVFLLTDTVDAGYGSNDDNIISGKQRLGSLMTHTVDLIIDR